MDNKNRADGNPGGVEKTVNFLVGKGFYIVLFLCLAAIGISGYVILFSGTAQIDPEIGEIPDIGLATTVDLGQLTSTSTSTESTEAHAVIGTTAISVPTLPETRQTLTSPPPAETSAPPETLTGSTTEHISQLFYVAPVSGDIIQNFSGDAPVFNPTMGDWRVHAGVDYLAPVGTEVRAIANGTVERVYSDEFKGLCIEISHPDGLTSIYCGLEEAFVTPGDQVKAGNTVANVGTSAQFEKQSGPHLHLELREAGAAVDPMDYIS